MYIFYLIFFTKKLNFTFNYSEVQEVSGGKKNKS